jgi:microcystin-dependent protein
MSDPFLGQLKMFAGTFAPLGWLPCDGRLLPIQQYDALFNLLGTTYGGDGQTTFGIPDLRGRVPIAPGRGSDNTVYQAGSTGGTEGVTLTVNNLPAHTHTFAASTAAGTVSTPGGNFLAQTPTEVFIYKKANPSSTLNAGMVGTSPGGQPHENRQPYIAVNYIIATEGIYPPQS